MKEGRRTSSMKASYEAFKNNDFQLGREFLSRDSTSYSSSALASTLTQTLTSSATTDSRSGRKNKWVKFRQVTYSPPKRRWLRSPLLLHHCFWALYLPFFWVWSSAIKIAQAGVTKLPQMCSEVDSFWHQRHAKSAWRCIQSSLYKMF